MDAGNVNRLNTIVTLCPQDVDIAGGKHTAKVRLFLPHDFDERRKYPLLVNVYAGPNSQQVGHSWLFI